MSLLVLHAGAEFCDGAIVQQELGTWASRLEELGVVTGGAHDTRSWRELGLGLVRGNGSAPAEGLLAKLAAGATAAVVSADALCDALHPPKRAEAFAARMREREIEVRVVVFVREQIGFINHLYTRRLLNLDTARGFPEFVSDPVPPHRFDYAASYGSVADTAGLDLVAHSYPDMLEHGPTNLLLRAAGVDESVLTALPASGAAVDGEPGPVLVAATRLLHKRLRRQKMFEVRTKPELRELGRRLRETCAERNWDEGTFWGWDEDGASEAAEEYRLSNDLFAQFVWGTDWQEPFSSAPQQVTDLPGLEPDLVREIVDTVDGLVKEAVSGRAILAPTGGADA